jgi:hypothetical protein
MTGHLVCFLVQELSGDARDWSERDALVHAAMEKFRLTIRSRPDFDRGCYNLGTVFYTFAMALQGDTGGDPGDTARQSSDSLAAGTNNPTQATAASPQGWLATV